MKFSGKMFFKIILKVTKNKGSTLSIEDTFSKKSQGGPTIPIKNTYFEKTSTNDWLLLHSERQN